MGYDIETQEIGTIFTPPADYPLEEELRLPPPRPMPETARNSACMKYRRFEQYGFVAAALLAFAAHYVLPHFELGTEDWRWPYLLWAASVILLGYLVSKTTVWLALGDLKYLRHGRVLVGQVQHLTLEASEHRYDMEESRAYYATVLVSHPETGRAVLVRLPSESIQSESVENHECSLRRGDYVTGLYIPGKFEKTFRLYGFLGLNPDVKFVTQKNPYALLAFVLVVVIPMVSVVFGFLHYSSRHEPLAHPMSPLCLGVFGVCIGLGLLWGIVTEIQWYRNAPKRREEKQQAALRGEAMVADVHAFTRYGIAFGMVGLGAMVAYMGLMLANGLLDDSVPMPRPVVLHNWPNLEEEALPWRDIIKFSFAGETETHTIFLFRSELAILGRESNKVTAMVKAGYVGWPWVEALVPRMEEAPLPSDSDALITE